MLVEVHDGEIGHGEVEELDGAVAGGDDELVLVDLGPGEVVESVVGVEGLFDDDALGAEAQAEEAAVADETIVGRRRDGEARVVVGRVLYGVGVEARRAEL